MKLEHYETILARLQRSAAALAARKQSAIAQQPLCHEPLATVQAQEADSKRIVVRVTSYRKRLIDEDNLCVKYHVDALRYAGLLRSDAPQHTHIEARQVKVKPGQPEGTFIEIIKPS